MWQASLGEPSGGPLALLATGKVLGAGCQLVVSAACSQADLYNPSTNEWTPTGSLNQSRGGLTLTRLLNGQVLAAGGRFPRNGNYGPVTYTASAEVYKP